MTSPDRIAEIARRAEAATKGTWIEMPLGDVRLPACLDNEFICCYGGKLDAFDQDQAERDASFIAHAHEDIPYLLEALAASEARVKELEESVESERACPHRAEGYRQGVEDAAKVAENGPDLSDNPSPWAIAYITDDPVASLQAAVCLTKQRIANSIRALINQPDAPDKRTE